MAAPSGGGGSEFASPNRFRELTESPMSEYFYDTMDVERSNNSQLNPLHSKPRVLREILKIVRELTKKVAYVSNTVGENRKNMRSTSDSLGSVASQLASVHIQIASITKENEMISTQMSTIPSQHQCPLKSCKGGPVCTHSKCAACGDPHRATNRNCPARIPSHRGGICYPAHNSNICILTSLKFQL
jgi:hypothetical protein